MTTADTPTPETLDELSRQATPGPWRDDYLGYLPKDQEIDVRIGANLSCINGLSAWFTICALPMPDEAEIGMSDSARNRERVYTDAKYIVALANAHRSGQLVPASALASEIEARKAAEQERDEHDRCADRLLNLQIKACVERNEWRARAEKAEAALAASPAVVRRPAAVDIRWQVRSRLASDWMQPNGNGLREGMNELLRCVDAALEAALAEPQADAQAGEWPTDEDVERACAVFYPAGDPMPWNGEHRWSDEARSWRRDRMRAALLAARPAGPAEDAR